MNQLKAFIHEGIFKGNTPFRHKEKKKTDMKYILVDCLQSSFSSSTLSELRRFKVLRLPLKKPRKLSVIVHLGSFYLPSRF